MMKQGNYFKLKVVLSGVAGIWTPDKWRHHPLKSRNSPFLV